MSNIPQDASLQLLGQQNSASIYQLCSDGLSNRYYVVSGEGTRHLMASPEVVGYESYLAMKPATTGTITMKRSMAPSTHGAGSTRMSVRQTCIDILAAARL